MCRKIFLEVLRGRWFMFFASFLTMSCSSGANLFGIYSLSIKSSLEYRQSSIGLLSVVKDFGVNLGLLFGVLSQVAPTWVILLLGCSMNFLGYFLMWLSVSGHVPKPKEYLMCIYVFIAANAQNFVTTGILAPCMSNFPENRGIMLGLLQGFAGLMSGSILTRLHLVIHGKNPDFLLFQMAWVPSSLSLFCIYFIRPIKFARQPKDHKVFYTFFYVSIGFCLVMMALTFYVKSATLSRGAYAGVCVLLFIVLLFPLYIAITKAWKQTTIENIDSSPSEPEGIQGIQATKREETHSTIPEKPEDKEEIYSSVPDIEDIPVTDSSRTDLPEGIEEIQVIEIDQETHFSVPVEFEDIKEIHSPIPEIEDRPVTQINKSWPKRGDDHSILQGIINIDMVIIFVTCLLGLGSCLTSVNSMSHIARSLGYPITTVVSLMNTWIYYGRVFSGFLSERISAYKFPRSLMTTSAILFSCLGHVLIAFPRPGSVYVACIIIGFSYGAQLPSVTATISEVFGMKNFNIFYNVVQLASPIGAFIFNIISGQLYEAEALKQGAKKLSCIGPQCYKQSSVILADVALVGAVVSFVLVARTWNFYKTNIYRKFREPAAIEQETA